MPLPLNAIKRHFFLASRFLKLLMLGPFLSSSRGELKKVASVMGWGRLQPKLPRVAINKLAPSEPAVRMLECEHVHYNVSLYELWVLNSLVAHRRPRRLLEIGTFDGRTTLNLAANSSDGAQVFTFDLPPDDVRFSHAEVGTRFRDRPENSKITQLLGDTKTYDFSDHKDSMEFIFVDAGHDYVSASNDTRVALELINRENGVIVWHDYSTWPGVLKTVEEHHAQGGELADLRWIEGTTMAVLSFGDNKRAAR